MLVLDGAAYWVQGEYPRGTTAKSVLLPTFAVDATAVFDAGLGLRMWDVNARPIPLHHSRCTVSGEKAGIQTAMYSAPSAAGLLY